MVELPQRFVWLPTLDPVAPDYVPREPDRFPDPRPDWDTAEDVDHSGEWIILRVPKVARREVDAHRLAVLRGDLAVDPLGSHALLTRLKVAVALMAIESRTTMNDEDWTLAGQVMAVSDATRADIQRAIADKARQDRRARALDADEHDEIVSARKLARCKRAIGKRLAKTGLEPVVPGLQVAGVEREVAASGVRGRPAPLYLDTGMCWHCSHLPVSCPGRLTRPERLQ